MIKLPCILTSYTPRVDGTFSVKFATNEITEDELLQLNRIKGQFGTLTFTPEDNGNINTEK